MHHIHLSVPNGGEFHVGPFASASDALECQQAWPSFLRERSVISSAHPIVGTVFAPSIGVETLLGEME